ncbi:MAG TPA: hypothetical protein VFG71_03360 [Nitrospiraceae bacterium]|nr:hypothetical protein [Nitrospiraceae bacterium]
MFTRTGAPALAGISPKWTIFFARQPEPDLEFTEEDLAGAAPQPASPMKSPKPSNKRPILWLLLLAVLAGVAYIAMEPDVIMRALEPYLGETEPRTTPVTPPPQAKLPPEVSPVIPPKGEPASPSVLPTPTTPSASKASAPAPIPGPLFAEGQKVSAVPDPARPDGPILLFADSARTKPGPTVAAGSFLTVLDGDLQGSNWIYAVLTEDGRQGWVAEKHLKFRR